MMKHLVLVSDSELQNIISGNREFLVRFFKKRPDFFGQIASGDLVYFRKKEVLGQFFIGKLILIEKLDVGDWVLLKDYLGDWGNKGDFQDRPQEKRVMVIVQIEKLEQFITSPIEMLGNLRKEWVVLE